MKWYSWALALLIVVIVISQINRFRVMKNLKNIQLSKNFTLDEFVITATGVENIPGEKEIECLRQLALNILQPLRDALGKAIHINSGYRSPAVNAVVPGSSKTSQHMLGEAADIHVDGMTNQEIIDLVRKLKLPYDQIIDEWRGASRWVHISFTTKRANRYAWLTRRDPGPGRINEYETVKIGLA